MAELIIFLLVITTLASFVALMVLLSMFLWKVIKEEFKDGN